MPLLSLLLIAVLAFALPLPPTVRVIAATGLCCCVLLVRILLALFYSLSSHSPPLPAAIPTALSAALRRQQTAAFHHHQPPNAQLQLQLSASSQPTAPSSISLRGHELPYVQHFRYLGRYFNPDCRLDKDFLINSNQLATNSSGCSSPAARKALAQQGHLHSHQNAHKLQLGVFGPIVWSRVLAHHDLPAAAA
jgi:hypothetical protein